MPCSVCIQLALTSLEGIILGTHHEKGAFTFWSYAIGLPLPSSAILSWKFCHVLHKVLRDGHPNVSVPSAMSLLLHWQGEISGSEEMGSLLYPSHLSQAVRRSVVSHL